LAPIPFIEDLNLFAKLIKDACDAFVFDTELLIEVICTRTNEEINAMKEAWSSCFKEKNSLYERVRDETRKMLSGNHFQAFMLSLLDAKRSQNGPIDETQVQKDAEELLRFIIQETTPDIKSKFSDIFSKRSFSHITAIAQAFQQISKNTR